MQQRPEPAAVTLRVHNSSGQPIAVLVNAVVSAGYQVATWHASEISAGIYFYRLRAGQWEITRKMILVK